MTYEMTEQERNDALAKMTQAIALQLDRYAGNSETIMSQILDLSPVDLYDLISGYVSLVNYLLECIIESNHEYTKERILREIIALMLKKGPVT